MLEYTMANTYGGFPPRTPQLFMPRSIKIVGEHVFEMRINGNTAWTEVGQVSRWKRQWHSTSVRMKSAQFVAVPFYEACRVYDFLFAFAASS